MMYWSNSKKKCQQMTPNCILFHFHCCKFWSTFLQTHHCYHILLELRFPIRIGLGATYSSLNKSFMLVGKPLDYLNYLIQHYTSPQLKKFHKLCLFLLFRVWCVQVFKFLLFPNFALTVTNEPELWNIPSCAYTINTNYHRAALWWVTEDVDELCRSVNLQVT